MPEGKKNAPFLPTFQSLTSLPTEKKEGLKGKVEGIFHHKKHDEASSAAQPSTDTSSTSTDQKEPHESGMNKFKDYMAEDKKMEEEGKEYGGLM